jgi:hypothetical protein
MRRQTELEMPRSGRRRAGRLVVGLLGALLSAYVALFLFGLAHAVFNGCWLSCGGTPNFWGGVVVTVIAGALVMAPVVLLMLALRASRTAIVVVGATGVLLIVGAWMIFSLDPANREYFVASGVVLPAVPGQDVSSMSPA